MGRLIYGYSQSDPKVAVCIKEAESLSSGKRFLSWRMTALGAVHSLSLNRLNNVLEFVHIHSVIKVGLNPCVEDDFRAIAMQPPHILGQADDDKSSRPD